MGTIAKVPRESRWSVFYLLAALAVLAALVAAPQASAFNPFLNNFNNQYQSSSTGANANCAVCHLSTNNDGNGLNEYGNQFRAAGQSFTAIENLQSMNNNGSTTMLDEINASTQPGWTTGNNNTYDFNGNLISNTASAPGGISGSLDPGGGNIPPTADANGPYNGTAGQQVSFDGSGSSDSDGTIVAYDWDFGDNNTGTGVSPTHTYAAAGTYNVSLVVTDNAGDSSAASTSTATIVAALQDPIADPNGPYNGFEGVALTLNGSASFDPDGGAITQYDWGFGDGGTGTGVSTTHTYNAAGTYTVTLTVVDDEGAVSAPATTTAIIEVPPANIPPTSDPNGPYTGTTGQSVSFNGSGSNDPDGGTVASYAWDFGDGNTGTGVSPTHTYTAAGTFNVSLTVTDNEGATSAPATTTATITDNVPPPAADCDGELNIDRASYSNSRDRIRVEGDGGEEDAGDFVLTNAFDPTQFQASGSEENDRQFDFRVSNLDPVPCTIRVEQPGSGRCAIRDVSNAPEDCAPKEPEPPVEPPPGEDELTARGDTYATPVGDTIAVTASRVSGVLYNDFGGEPPLTARLTSDPTAGSLDAFGDDGSFTYTPGGTMVDNQVDTFTYVAVDANGDESAEATVTVQALSKQVDFKIMMNYELGMHCTGFEFAYCCVLPPYNSIVAQVVKPAQNDPACAQDEDDCEDFFDGYPRMLEGSTTAGLDGLNRETVVNDWDYTNSTFKKYQLRYYHDAQPRQEGNTSKPNTSTLISAAEGNSLQYFNTVFDSAAPDPNTNALVFGPKNGAENVLLGDGAFGGPTDNYANGWLNHFYIYVDPATGGPNLEGHGNTGLEANKIRLGVAGQVAYPPDCGAGLQPLGPDTTNGLPMLDELGNVINPPVPNDCGGNSNGNVLTFSANTGTVVYTQAKVLEDLPIMLTSPRIWEALGLPLTTFEDTIGFFADPGAVDEDAIRPFVAMKASLHEYPSGIAVTGSNGQPVIGFGTAPIDIPNCERCHSAPSVDPATQLPNVNSPNWIRDAKLPPDDIDRATFPHGGPLAGTGLEDMTNLEMNFWMAYYDIVPGVDSTWYPRLKGAAINMLTLHDVDVGTSFTANYAGVECSANPDPTDPNIDPDSYLCSSTNGLADLTERDNIPQNTRLGAESVICQRCHADNVIANVKSATRDPAGNFPIPPISEAIHNQHRNESEGGVIVFNDSLGRDGGCQGCHPAHRSDGVMDDYPITLGGDNANAGDDNRLNLGGCFVGRDVHSNPMKDIDGAETPSHMNAVGDWLLANVVLDGTDPNDPNPPSRGIWCTNCHTQLGQELWRTEDCNDLIHGDCVFNPRAAGPDLSDVVAAINIGRAALTPPLPPLSEQDAINFLDPKVNQVNGVPTDRTSDQTHAVWNPAITDAGVATIEVGPNGPVDVGQEGDFTVNILSFCTTPDCVDSINDNKGDESLWRYPEGGSVDGEAGFTNIANEGVAVPFSAATDGRDHWLSAGEPHCADCHQAPYVEQSGNITAFPPFNYPAKASLMRYTRGHQDVSCQGCHESIHGLYPVTPAIDTTSYAQAAALNNDGSHGPLKCATCHTFVDGEGIPNWVDNLRYNDPTTPGNDNLPVAGNFDRAVGWMHTYTDEANPNQDVCLNCHGSETPEIDDDEYLEHAMTNRVSRVAMDNAERAVNGGDVFGEDNGQLDFDQLEVLCDQCHDDELGEEECDEDWREHLIEGRIAQSVWEKLSEPLGGCGW